MNKPGRKINKNRLDKNRLKTNNLAMKCLFPVLFCMHLLIKVCYWNMHFVISRLKYKDISIITVRQITRIPPWKSGRGGNVNAAFFCEMSPLSQQSYNSRLSSLHLRSACLKRVTNQSGTNAFTLLRSSISSTNQKLVLLSDSYLLRHYK